MARMCRVSVPRNVDKDFGWDATAMSAVTVTTIVTATTTTAAARLAAIGATARL